MTTAKDQTNGFFKIVCVLIVPALMIAIILAVDIIFHPLVPDRSFHSILYRLFAGLLLAPGTIVIGFLIMRRVPGNTVGPLLILWGCGLEADPLRSAAGDFLNVLAGFDISILWWSFVSLLYFFPTGKPHPPRAKLLIVSGLLVFLLLWILVSLGSKTTDIGLNEVQTFTNPLFVPFLEPFYSTIQKLGGLIVIVLLLGAFVSLILRYRASRDMERQQMNWFLWLFTVLVMIILVPDFVFPGWKQNVLGPFEATFKILNQIAIYLFPTITIGNAILRHRLYDIDIIIRRTLIYATLTTILAVVYFGTVVLVQQVFRAFTGQTTDLTIVISTLVIAALFNPLRHRIQAVIDRRLYRRKYDVEKTLEVFNRTLREEVDMETLQANLVGVVNDTMQPTKIALWVKPSVEKTVRH